MSRRRSAPDALPGTTGGRPKASARALAQVIERSSRVQGPAAEAYVARLRRSYPGAGPAEIVTKLEKRYLTALTARGAAVGSAATVFVGALPSVDGTPADHRERRRALLLGVLVGDDTKRALGDLIGPSRT